MASWGEIIIGLVSLTLFIFVRLFSGWKTKYHGTPRTPTTIVFHALKINVGTDVTVCFSNTQEIVKLVVKIGRKIPEYIECDIVQSAESLIIDFKNYAKLTIGQIKKEGGSRHMYEFAWDGYGVQELEDAFDILSGEHWYGVGHVFNQPWPMEKWNCSETAFISAEPGPLGGGYGGVQERLWLTSTGIGIFVNFDVPLFTSINDKHSKLITLNARHKTPYRNPERKNIFLRYSVCIGEDVKHAFRAISETHIARPPSFPDERMFRYPIWSTWAQYKTHVNQSKVLEYAKAIRNHGFKDAQLEIDDDWTPAYGDWEFDHAKFPDPKQMVADLKDMKFRVALWVHPFANIWSRSFQEERKGNSIWMMWKRFSFPAITHWWNGFAAVLDVTNPKAIDWFECKMKQLRETYKIDTFKFDAGDACYVPRWATSKEDMATPNTYTKLSAELAHRIDRALNAQEVRTGVGVQHLPMFFRLQDKDSNWGNFNGLKTVIPHVLTQGLLGYPFVLPDMIGGNAYLTTGFPEKELFIRWMQVNALMPAMQFSVVPWHYGEDVVKIAKNMCELHEKYSDKIISLAEEATATGAPIIRPLWWIAPDDEAALTISTEFLLGDDLVVAPVLEPGANTRDLYLPQGTWRDELHNNLLKGGMWYTDYPAELEELPHFTKV